MTGVDHPLKQSHAGALREAAAGRESREVAEAIFALAQQPAGARPLRTTVPYDAATEAINAAAAPVQREFLSAFGLDALLPKEASVVSD